MKRVPFALFIAAIVVALMVGGIAGFLFGVASTRMGQAFLAGLGKREERAQTQNPKTIDRERFRLQYPTNWSIDANADDYDPDHVFSIRSSGFAFVRFAIGDDTASPEENLQPYIASFEKLSDTSTETRFEKYGSYTGKGVAFARRPSGLSITTKVFSFRQDDLSVVVVQHCPDKLLGDLQSGLSLVESSFTIKNKDP